MLVGGEGEAVDFGEVGEEDFGENEWHLGGGACTWRVLIYELVACLV